jgi:hypothetical protein
MAAFLHTIDHSRSRHPFPPPVVPSTGELLGHSRLSCPTTTLYLIVHHYCLFVKGQRKRSDILIEGGCRKGEKVVGLGKKGEGMEAGETKGSKEQQSKLSVVIERLSWQWAKRVLPCMSEIISLGKSSKGKSSQCVTLFVGKAASQLLIRSSLASSPTMLLHS